MTSACCSTAERSKPGVTPSSSRSAPTAAPASPATSPRTRCRCPWPSIQERWRVTGGKDPLFAAIDGANCPELPQADAASHSLLLERGLVPRLPAVAAEGRGRLADRTEFTLEVVRDPTGCNTSAKYGLTSANPMVSVYRRPRVVANTKYTTHQGFGVGLFVGKNGLPSAKDPETGKPVAMNLMSDARAPTLKTQAVEAAINHLQSPQPPTAAQLAQITDFEARVYTAQVAHDGAGSLVEPRRPAGVRTAQSAPR